MVIYNPASSGELSIGVVTAELNPTLAGVWVSISPSLAHFICDFKVGGGSCIPADVTLDPAEIPTDLSASIVNSGDETIDVRFLAVIDNDVEPRESTLITLAPGESSYTFCIPMTAPRGDLTIGVHTVTWAVIMKRTTDTTFSNGPGGSASYTIPEEAHPTSLTISLDKTESWPGDTIGISGVLSDTVDPTNPVTIPNQNIYININAVEATDAVGSPITALTDLAGEYAFDYTITEADLTTGTVTFQTVYKGTT